MELNRSDVFRRATRTLREGSVQVPTEDLLHSGLEIGAGQGQDQLDHIFSQCHVRFARNARLHEAGLLRADGTNMPFDRNQLSDRAVAIRNWWSERGDIASMQPVGQEALPRIAAELQKQAFDGFLTSVNGSTASDGTDFVFDVRMCYSAWGERIRTSVTSAEGAIITGSYVDNVSKCSVVEGLGRMAENMWAGDKFSKSVAERAVLVGYEGEVSMRQRLVVNEEGDEATYAETSHRCIPRLLPCCHHVITHIRITDDMRGYPCYQVASYVNTIQERLRGVHCDFPELTHNLIKPKVRRARLKCMWLAVREFRNLVVHIRNQVDEQMQNPDIIVKPNLEQRSAGALSFKDLLKCGVKPLDLYRSALRYAIPQTVDVREAENCLSCGLSGFAVMAALSEVKTVELLEAVLFVLVVRASSTGDEAMVYGDGVTPVVTPLTATMEELTPGLLSSETVPGTASLSEWIGKKLLWATDATDLDGLRTLDVMDLEEPRSVALSIGHLAADTDGVLPVPDDKKVRGLMRGKCKMLSRGVQEDITIRRDEVSFEARHRKYKMFRVSSNQIGVCAENAFTSLKVALNRLKSVQISGFGLGLEISTGELDDTFKTGQGLFNEILSGEWGVRAAMFVLSLMFRAEMKVQCPDGNANSYIPRDARGNVGYKVTTPLSKNITANLAYTIITDRQKKKSDTLWVPGDGLNVFKVSFPGGNRMAHFEESKRAVEVKYVGMLTYGFRVGQ